MDRHTRFESIVRGMTAVVDCPVTVKMRAGIHNRHWNAHKLAPKLRDWGVAMATVSRAVWYRNRCWLYAMYMEEYSVCVYITMCVCVCVCVCDLTGARSL